MILFFFILFRLKRWQAIKNFSLFNVDFLFNGTAAFYPFIYDNSTSTYCHKLGQNFQDLHFILNGLCKEIYIDIHFKQRLLTFIFAGEMRWGEMFFFLMHEALLLNFSEKINSHLWRGQSSLAICRIKIVCLHCKKLRLSDLLRELWAIYYL